MLAMDDLTDVDEISPGNAVCSLTVTTLGMGVWMGADRDTAAIGMASLFRAACACTTDFAIPIAMRFVRRD